MGTKLPQDKHHCERCGIVKPRHEMCISKAGRVQPVCLACNVPPPGMKWCGMHHTWEPVEGFGFNRANPDGLASICRAGKAEVDERVRADRAAIAPTKAGDVGAMECTYCPFEVECRGKVSTAYRQVWRDVAPDLGATDELPCIPESPHYAEYARVVRAKKKALAASKKHNKVTIEVINHILTMTGD